MSERYYTVDGQMIGYEEGGVRKDFLTDHLGSIIAIMDENEVRVFDTRYSAYGRNRWITGTGSGFGWVGSLGYRETGLSHMSHYVRARHYSYVTGGWSTVDPLWPDESAYGYVGGRSSVFADPSGLQAGNPAGDLTTAFPHGASLPQIPYDEPCFQCAAAVYLTFRDDWYHRNEYGPFSHCLACCVIAGLTKDPICTWKMQESQMGGSRAGDPPERQRMRTIPCAYGIKIAGTIKIDPINMTASCAKRCFERFPHPGGGPGWNIPPVKPPPPPHPLPNTNPAGCHVPPGSVLCYPVIPPGKPQ